MYALAGDRQHAHEGPGKRGPDFMARDVAHDRAHHDGLAGVGDASNGARGLKDTGAGADNYAFGNAEMFALMAGGINRINERLHSSPSSMDSSMGIGSEAPKTGQRFL
jgi:hypothetical protein